jgi:hypothetical protein
MKMDFFGLWSAIMDAAKNPDDDPFGELCEQIFNGVYPDGIDMQKWFQEELEKIKYPETRKSLKDAAESLMERVKYFYFAVGFALAQDYDVLNPEVQKQINFLRQRIRNSKAFPLPAKLKSPERGQRGAGDRARG